MQIMKTIVRVCCVHLKAIIEIIENFACCSTVKQKRWHREEEEVG